MRDQPKKRVFWNFDMTQSEEKEFQDQLERIKELKPNLDAVDTYPLPVDPIVTQSKPSSIGSKPDKPAKPKKSEWEKRLAKGKRSEAKEKKKIKRSQEIRERLKNYKGLKRLGGDEPGI